MRRQPSSLYVVYPLVIIPLILADLFIEDPPTDTVAPEIPDSVEAALPVPAAEGNDTVESKAGSWWPR